MKKAKGRNRESDSLRREILEHVKLLDPKQPHLINVNARHGEYQILVTPSGEGQEVEIKGHIHHVYMTPDDISAYPQASEVEDNLKHTVIVRDITVQIDYPGKKKPQVDASEYINLAGAEGDGVIKKMKRKLSSAAEHIMEDDISRALEGGEESITY